MVMARRARVATQVPTSSLADIAFLLLIFFLVTTVFDEEKGLSLVLPQETAEVSAKNVLELRVLGDGGVEVRRGESVAVQRVMADGVEGIWRAESARNADLIAVVRTEGSAPYGRMVDVLDALQTAGARRISLQRSGSGR